MGLVSDIDFSALVITIDNFDLNATSVAFLALTDPIYMGVIPVPGSFAVLRLPPMRDCYLIASWTTRYS